VEEILSAHQAASPVSIRMSKPIVAVCIGPVILSLRLVEVLQLRTGCRPPQADTERGGTRHPVGNELPLPNIDADRCHCRLSHWSIVGRECDGMVAPTMVGTGT